MNISAPLTHRKSRPLALEVKDAIAGQIADGRLTRGDKLPTEAQLMQEHAVSRTVIREALSHLQASGFVETRHGVGTFVLDSSPQGPAEAPPAAYITNINDAMDMLELRISLESEAAYLAALRRTEADLENLRTTLADFENQARRGEKAVEPDHRFHLGLARATGNHFFEDVFRYIGQGGIPRYRVDTAPFAEEDAVAYIRRINREHYEVLKAIERRDAETARAAMRLHLVASRERLKKIAAHLDAPHR